MVNMDVGSVPQDTVSLVLMVAFVILGVLIYIEVIRWLMGRRRENEEEEYRSSRDS